MAKFSRLVIAVLIFAACGPARESAEVPGAAMPSLLSPPPIYALLGYREDLGLDSEQVTQLDSVAQWVQEVNSPLADEVREKSRRRIGGASQRVAVTAETEPLLKQINENRRRALDRVAKILSPEQRDEVCGLFAPGRDQRSQPRQRSERQGRRHDEAGPDTLLVPQRQGWPWCMGARPT